MRIALKQQCEIAGVLLAVLHQGKPAFHTIDEKLAKDSYFKSLVADGKIVILDEPVKSDDESLVAEKLEAAKLELAELNEKEKLTKKDEKRVLELKSLIGE